MEIKTAKKEHSLEKNPRQERRNLLIFSIILSLILAGIFIFNLSLNKITGNAVKDSYTYTKAICNETNFCQDYVIECQGNETISINPITGAFVQNNENWQDPRNETRNKLC